MQSKAIVILHFSLIFYLSTGVLFASETVHEAALYDINGDILTNATLKAGEHIDVVLHADGPRLVGGENLLDAADLLDYVIYYDKTKLEFISYTRADGPDNTFLTDATNELMRHRSYELSDYLIGSSQNDAYGAGLDGGAGVFQGIAYDGDLYDNDPETKDDLLNDCEDTYLNIKTTKVNFPTLKKTANPSVDLEGYECAGYRHFRGVYGISVAKNFPGTGTSFTGDDSVPLGKIQFKAKEGASGVAKLIGVVATWGYGDVAVKENVASINITNSSSGSNSGSSYRRAERDTSDKDESEVPAEDFLESVDIDTPTMEQVIPPISPEAVKPISVVCIDESCYPHKEGDAPIELPMGSQTVLTYLNGIDEPTVVYAPDSPLSTSPKGESTLSLWGRVKAFFAPLFWWL